MVVGVDAAPKELIGADILSCGQGTVVTGKVILSSLFTAASITVEGKGDAVRWSKRVRRVGAVCMLCLPRVLKMGGDLLCGTDYALVKGIVVASYEVRVQNLQRGLLW